MSTNAVVPVAPNGQEIEQARFLPVMNIAAAVQRRAVIVEAVQKLMTEDIDYGKIPGTQKPTLMQPGCDKLCNLFGLVPHYIVEEKEEDWTGESHGGEPFFTYTLKCILMRGEHAMGEGIGSCNSWESKYRYRKSERVCPKCGKDTIIRGKAEYGGGWLCYQKKGGCGAKFGDNDRAIVEQITGRVANPDIFDQVNTILKMARKRAKVAATLDATSAHEFFTQDMEDIAPPEPEAPQSAPRKSTPVSDQPVTDLDRNLAAMKDKNSCLNLLLQMKAKYAQHVTEAAYNEMLSNFGLKSPSDVKSIGEAKKLFTALWKELEIATMPPEPGPDFSEDRQ